MFNKFMKFIRRLYRKYLSFKPEFPMKKYKISAENLSNYACLARPKDTGTWGIN